VVQFWQLDKVLTDRKPLHSVWVHDIKPDQLVRRAGGRTRAFIGGEDVERHCGVTVPGKIKMKDFFAALEMLRARNVGPQRP
jgi:hypothetical protein